ncbi:uncharacterized protein LOC115920856 [Strongylocentrotus purpuratus]|uniref:Uncharacterized protein n=1 Tax=Strongylocentrotus purpuratus TaxID=7668 RepID=A0A7M7ND70_STRPU|nr:uncharacterized protein LOC115920856 [Strongylocentrotus purpuratus]
MQVQTLGLHGLQCPTPASAHYLVKVLCSMPNLTDLTLAREAYTGEVFNEEFYSALKAKASSIQGCFPQIRKGNFRLNGDAQDDLNSFLDTLTCLQRSVQYM